MGLVEREANKKDQPDVSPIWTFFWGQNQNKTLYDDRHSKSSSFTMFDDLAIGILIVEADQMEARSNIIWVLY